MSFLSNGDIMGDKSEQKREYILEKATQVFTEKGFRSVTMKDIVEACQISRGGLYLYYASTEEVFKDVLARRDRNEENEGSDVDENAGAAQLLGLFLKEQKKEIMHAKKSLIGAEYEYNFAHPAQGRNNVLKKKFREAALVLERLIAIGIETGEFRETDARVAANHIMYTIEGLKITALTMGVSSEAVDKELLHIVQSIVIED